MQLNMESQVIISVNIIKISREQGIAEPEIQTGIAVIEALIKSRSPIQ